MLALAKQPTLISLSDVFALQKRDNKQISMRNTSALIKYGINVIIKD